MSQQGRPGDRAERILRRVVVEGPIGVGKTTLARRLAESLGAELRLEAPEANPFLPAFYREGERHALPTQLFFLLQRLRQQEAAKEDLLETPQVWDYLIDKDRLFAELTLNDAELALYDQIHGQIDLQSPMPDLVVYLQAPVPVLLDRIRRRDIAAEASIRSEYLTRVVEAYAGFFHHYERSPLLIVNAARIDWVSREDHYAGLLQAIREPQGSRRYFNPDPELI